jgi:hypothetical protein
MYHYAFYGYLAYKVYEYSNLLDYALSVGRGVKYVYCWAQPAPKEIEHGEYLDWVLITEDEDSLLKKNVNEDKDA